MDKKLELKDYLEIILRRKWFFIIPFIVIIMVAAGYARWAPNIYKASTLILVEQPQLSTSYYQPTVAESSRPETMEDRLLTFEPQIMSRTFLETIVKEFDFLAEPKKNPSPGSVIQSLRKRITIQVAGTEAFNISFEDRDPVMAMKIVNRLTTLFIERNLQQREELSLETISFFDRELERLKNLLKEQERKVSEFRASHFGMLPEDLNLGVRGAAPADITEGDDLLMLYSLLRQLRLKYTDEHPEIVRLKAKIAEAGRERNNMKGTTTLEARSSRADAETQSGPEKNRLQVEQQLTELTRGYEVTKTEYQSLLNKRLQAELATSMERKQQGKRFQVLDEAKIPESPIRPNRLTILLIGLVSAMTAGVGLVTVIERLDTSFYEIDDLEAFTELPVIANISKITEKRTFYTMVAKFTKLPVIANISKITKKFFLMLEELSERILSLIASISSNIAKKKKGRN
jgi:uncharacterized protein involved in exopolysaccharide biosynthesis